MLNDRASQVIAADSVYTAPVDSVMTVWARSAEPRRTAGYLLRIHKVATGEIINLNLTFAGLALLITGAFLLLGSDPRSSAAALSPRPSTSAAWTLANLALVFLGVRLVLGYRITYATPYYERGADSAVGAWIATIIGTVLLLEWSTWARRAAIIIAACGVPLSVIARQLAVFATVTLVVLYVVALLLWRLKRGALRRADVLPRLRLGAPLLTLALLGALNFVVLVRRL